MNKPFKPAPTLPVMADVMVSISDLKKNPAAVVAEARKRQVAITNRNEAVAYVVSPEVWDHILDVFDDSKLLREMDLHEDDLKDAVTVSIDQLLDL